MVSIIERTANLYLYLAEFYLYHVFYSVKEKCFYVKKNATSFNTLSNTHDHNTRHCDLIRIDKCSFATVQNNFYHVSTKLFNSLPPSIRALTFASFKNCVKSMLYEQCFYNLNEYFNYVKMLNNHDDCHTCTMSWQ